MYPRLHRVRGGLGYAGLCAALLAACDGDGSRPYHGCELLYQRSNFGDSGLGFVHQEPAECPIRIPRAGVTVRTAADMYDNNGLYREAELLVINSANFRVGRDLRSFFPSGGRRVLTLFASYPAATGRNFVGDYDDARFEARGAAIAELGLRNRTQLTQPLAANISGTSIPHSNTTGSWTASASGGASPYRFDRYRNGSWVHSGSSYTAGVGTGAFSLRVEISDAYSSTAADFRMIDVDGIRVSMSGPGLVYSSGGGGSWTATGEGGYSPYTYGWYVDGTLVGSGSSWSGYPGEGLHQLRVQMGDARQATHGTTMEVHGIGNNTDPGGVSTRTPGGHLLRSGRRSAGTEHLRTQLQTGDSGRLAKHSPASRMHRPTAWEVAMGGAPGAPRLQDPGRGRPRDHSKGGLI
jgi:hypothetical protein